MSKASSSPHFLVVCCAVNSIRFSLELELLLLYIAQTANDSLIFMIDPTYASASNSMARYHLCVYLHTLWEISSIDENTRLVGRMVKYYILTRSTKW